LRLSLQKEVRLVHTFLKENPEIKENSDNFYADVKSLACEMPHEVPVGLRHYAKENRRSKKSLSN
jgi:hypothetical protein